MLSRIQGLKSDLRLSELEDRRYPELRPTTEEYTGKLVGGYENSLRKEQTQLYKVRLQLEHLENYRDDTLRECKETYSRLYYELQDRQAALERAKRQAEIEEAQEAELYEAKKTQAFVNQRRRIDDLTRQRYEAENEIRELRHEMDLEERNHQKKKESLRQAVADLTVEIEAMEDRKRDNTERGDQLYIELQKLRQRHEVLAARRSAEKKRLKSVDRDYRLLKNDYRRLKHAK